MSYSFMIAAPSKALALAALAVEMDKLVASQPVHHNDRDLAEAAVDGILAVTREPAEDEEVRIAVSGSLGWTMADPKPGDFTHASLAVNVSIGVKT